MLLLVSLAGEPASPWGKKFAARDSLASVKDDSDDARRCLAQLIWKAGTFDVRCDAAEKGKPGDAIVRFPSPLDSGDETNDLVAMEWYFARDETGRAVKAPAVVVVHESGRDMAVGRTMARGLRLLGLHAFLLQLPNYGYRRGKAKQVDAAQLVVHMRQGVADVRRARDAVFVMPWVDRSHIALQGTSLGGFVAATAGALDGGYDSVFLMLAGGNLYDLIENGEKDTAKVKKKLADAGFEGEKLKSLLQIIEPTRIAHRLSPPRTWLYSGRYDKVVPMKNALALASAARLDESHHIRMAANHYTGIIFLPKILSHIHRQITGDMQSK